MEKIFYLCFTNSLNITIFILLMVLLESFLKKHVSAICLYSFWLVLLIGLLIPVRLDTSKALFNIRLAQTLVEYNAELSKQNDGVPNFTLNDTQSQKNSTLNIRNKNIGPTGNEKYFSEYLKSVDITYIVQKVHVLLPQFWMIGTFLLLSLKGIRYHKYLKLLKRFAVPINQDIRENYNLCIQEWGLHNRNGRLKYDKIIIRQCPIIKSPMTFGIIKPTILFPEEAYSDKEFYFILKHELIHIRRRDSLIKLVRLIALTLNWYNPFCYVLSRHLEHWCETSCDELVTCHSTRSECVEYGKLLLKYTAVKNSTTNTINMFGGNDSMKDRLYSIMDQRKKYSSKVLAILLLFIVFSTVIVSSIPCSGASASSDNTVIKDPLVKTEEMNANITGNAGTSMKASDSAKMEAKDQDMKGIDLKAKTDSIIEDAIQAKDTPYLWGGNDLATGVDSSGFTQAIYKKAGYDLPRTIQEQYDICEKVSLDSLQNGDLIFYAGTSDNELCHVGIYIGENKIIHAKNLRDGVVIQEMNYRKPFSAGRMIED